MEIAAAEAANPDQEHGRAPLPGQVMQAALVGSVDASRAVLAIGTGRGRGPERSDDGDPVGRRDDPLDRKAGGDQRQDAFGQGNPAVTADLTDGQPASPAPDVTQSAGEPHLGWDAGPQSGILHATN